MIGSAYEKDSQKPLAILWIQRYLFFQTFGSSERIPLLTHIGESHGTQRQQD